MHRFYRIKHIPKPPSPTEGQGSSQLKMTVLPKSPKSPEHKTTFQFSSHKNVEYQYLITDNVTVFLDRKPENSIDLFYIAYALNGGNELPEGFKKFSCNTNNEIFKLEAAKKLFSDILAKESEPAIVKAAQAHLEEVKSKIAAEKLFQENFERFKKHYLAELPTELHSKEILEKLEELVHLQTGYTQLQETDPLKAALAVNYQAEEQNLYKLIFQAKQAKNAPAASSETPASSESPTSRI